LKSLTVFYQKSLKFTRYNINTENKTYQQLYCQKMNKARHLVNAVNWYFSGDLIFWVNSHLFKCKGLSCLKLSNLFLVSVTCTYTQKNKWYKFLIRVSVAWVIFRQKFKLEKNNTLS